MIKKVLNEVNDIAKIVGEMDIPNVSAVCKLIDILIVTDEEKRTIMEKLAEKDASKDIKDVVGNASIDGLITGEAPSVK